MPNVFTKLVPKVTLVESMPEAFKNKNYSDARHISGLTHDMLMSFEIRGLVGEQTGRNPHYPNSTADTNQHVDITGSQDFTFATKNQLYAYTVNYWAIMAFMLDDHLDQLELNHENKHIICEWQKKYLLSESDGTTGFDKMLVKAMKLTKAMLTADQFSAIKEETLVNDVYSVRSEVLKDQGSYSYLYLLMAHQGWDCQQAIDQMVAEVHYQWYACINYGSQLVDYGIPELTEYVHEVLYMARGNLWWSTVCSSTNQFSTALVPVAECPHNCHLKAISNPVGQVIKWSRFCAPANDLTKGFKCRTEFRIGARIDECTCDRDF
ncbi:unnamed protein product, partial [Medioppia subpectinata]